MFAKPFKIKSQTQVKGSDRKKLRAELGQLYPSLTHDDLMALIPTKEEVILARLYTHKGETVSVYKAVKDPVLFMLEKERLIFPTVYTLWRHPGLLHAFTTHPPVLDVLLGGADLMLPGVVINGPISPTGYGKFEKGAVVSVNTTSNAAPQAVGVTAHDNMEMYQCGRHGKAVNTMHVYRDHLWEMGSKALLPVIQRVMEQPVAHENSDDGADGSDSGEEGEKEEEGGSDDENQTDLSTNIQELKLEEPRPDEAAGPDAMDKLLEHCFLKAWKTSAKKVEPPILTSNFYRLHMVPACPDGAALDIKKSSYKKLSKFLNAMAKREIIEVKEFPKGVENITGINWAHDDLKEFIVDLSETTARPPPSSGGGSSFTPPQIEEVYQVSGDTVQFYRASGFSKGDVLLSNEVRNVVTGYIKEHKLKQEGSNAVNLDPVLHEAVVNRKEGYKETLRWDEIFSRMLGKMAPAVRITNPGARPIIRKGKLEPITMSVAKRSGNKKVTLVYNASTFGIDESEFARQIQVGVAASTSVGPAEHKPQGTTQVLIQGNQVAFVSKLLLETYGIPRKYIRGMELAVKKKK